MTTKDIAEKWRVSSGTVIRYCNKNWIPNCKKESGKWSIPDDSVKPLEEKEIRKLLLISVRVKNNHNLECDWSRFDFNPDNIRKVYESLVYRKYIKDISNIPTERIPYELIFTEKGLELIDSFVSKEIKDYTNLINSAVSILVNVIPAINK